MAVIIYLTYYLKKKNKKEIFENLLIYLLNVFDAIKLFVEKGYT